MSLMSGIIKMYRIENALSMINDSVFLLFSNIEISLLWLDPPILCLCRDYFLLFEHLRHHSDDWIFWIVWIALYMIRTSNNRCYCTLFLGFFFLSCSALFGFTFEGVPSIWHQPVRDLQQRCGRV